MLATLFKSNLPVILSYEVLFLFTPLFLLTLLYGIYQLNAYESNVEQNKILVSK